MDFRAGVAAGGRAREEICQRSYANCDITGSPTVHLALGPTNKQCLNPTLNMNATVKLTNMPATLLSQSYC